MQRRRLRDLLGTQLRIDVSEELWNYLDEYGFVADALGQNDPLRFLEGEARKIIAAGTVGMRRTAKAPQEGLSTPAAPSPGQEHAWALSQIAAVEASADPEVQRFRSTHLTDGLIPWTEFESWIAQQNQDDDPVRVDLTVTVPRDSIEAVSGGSWRLSPPLEVMDGWHVTSRTLAYAVPDSDWVQRIGVTANGLPDKLARLARSLAPHYGWRDAAAAVFIVCGVTPLIARVRYTTSPLRVRHGRSHSWASRITLDLDPSVTNEEICEIFTKLRKEQSPTPRRTMSSKHAVLAGFAGAQHRDKPWSERHRLWNTEHPQWAYPQQSNFRRDTIRALHRMQHP